MSFDPEVKVGQIRVFADAKEPLVALILESRGLAGFRIVPVSPYRVPANDREIVVGERVFQLWNVCTLPRGFVERSWIADTLAAEDVGRICQAIAEKGSLPAKLGEYERRHLVSNAVFLRHSAECRKAPVALWRSYGGWSIAAAVVIGLGVAWMLMRDDAEPVGTPQVITVRMERPQRYPELVENEKEPPEPPVPVPEVEVKVSPLEPPQVAKVEPAPDVREAPRVEKLAAAKAKARLKPLAQNAVVAGRKDAGAREPEVVRTLEWLKKTQKSDGSWGEKPLKDTALAVLALMAHGETADSATYGKTLVNGVRFLAEAKLDGHKRGEVQIVACALCGASAAVRNPNVRTAAERALATIGDNRSVEAGRDWRGLLVDLATPVASSTSRAINVAVGRSEKDEVADACVLVLRLLSLSTASRTKL